jgi:hypothetical protein
MQVDQPGRGWHCGGISCTRFPARPPHMRRRAEEFVGASFLLDPAFKSPLLAAAARNFLDKRSGEFYCCGFVNLRWKLIGGQWLGLIRSLCVCVVSRGPVERGQVREARVCLAAAAPSAAGRGASALAFLGPVVFLKRAA